MSRILMTADAVGGVWTYALELASALAPDHEVVLAVMGPAPSAHQQRAAEDTGVAAIHARPFALEWMDEPWPDVDAAAEWLLGLAGDTGADLVHLNGYAHASLAWNVPVLVVAHSDIVSWWRAVHGQEPGRDWTEYVRRVRQGLEAADAVVAPTAAARDVVAECYGVTGRVVHNGRSAHWVQSVQKEPFVLGVGRLWDLAKNVAALGRIAERVAWPVFVAGDDTAPDGTRRHLAGPLRALGSLPFDELAGWLGRAAVFASPARYEPFGLGALEAALSGCALVLGDIPSFRELWGDRGWGDAAVFVDPLDDERLARELDRLTRDPHRCVELGALARARAERYTPDAMATGYRDVYASISTCQATT